MASGAKPTCRDATEADYETVVNIDTNIYYGADYIPDRYMEYLKDPCRYLYVAEMDGKVVAFLMLSTTDDGTLLTGQAARVHADYQLKKVMFWLGLWAFDQTTQRVPTLKATTGVSINEEAELMRRDQNPAKKMFMRHEIVSEISEAELKAILNSVEFSRAYSKSQADASTVLTPQQAQGILECQEVNTDKMVPEGLWVVNAWEPYGMATSNYRRMVTKEAVVTREPHSRHITAISFSDFFRCSRGVSYLVHFYSEPQGYDSFRLIKSHLLQHLCLLKQHGFTENVTLFLLVPEQAPVQAIKGFVFSDLGLGRSTFPDTVDSSYSDYCSITDLKALRSKV